MMCIKCFTQDEKEKAWTVFEGHALCKAHAVERLDMIVSEQRQREADVRTNGRLHVPGQ